MKFRKILPFLFLLSCAPHLQTINLKQPYTAKGFAYIYNDYDFNNKTIKGKMNNEKLQISHQNLKTGTLLKILNPKNNESIVLKNIKRIKYPDFYKVLITQPVADKLNIYKNLPILEIIEIKKNKSFIAEEAKIYSEEKKISSKAPVASVQISNISKEKNKKSKEISDKIYINIATFFSTNTAIFLKERITKELTSLDLSKLKVKKINNKETRVILGPYTAINSLKNDYIKLIDYGFEELDIYINE